MSRGIGSSDDKGDSFTLSPCHLVTPSPIRAWLALVWFSWRRQARARTMVLIALGLLVVSVLLVAFWTVSGAWDFSTWRTPPRNRLRHEQLPAAVAGILDAIPGQAGRGGLSLAVLGSGRAAMHDVRMPVVVFTQAIVMLLFLSFLLPLWSLSFSTDAIGGERETRSLVWMLTRPLPRPAIYLAKFVALLPWSLGLTLFGFALMCLAGGAAGRQALVLCWPAVLGGTLAFTALFLLMGAAFRRPAVVAIVYSFFLETVLGNMPGYLKLVSINFYVRCLMFRALQTWAARPDEPFTPEIDPEVYGQLNDLTAWLVLMILTVLLLVVGMAVFNRKEYIDVE